MVLQFWSQIVTVLGVWLGVIIKDRLGVRLNLASSIFIDLESLNIKKSNKKNLKSNLL